MSRNICYVQVYMKTNPNLPLFPTEDCPNISIRKGFIGRMMPPNSAKGELNPDIV